MLDRRSFLKKLLLVEQPL